MNLTYVLYGYLGLGIITSILIVLLSREDSLSTIVSTVIVWPAAVVIFIQTWRKRRRLRKALEFMRGP